MSFPSPLASSLSTLGDHGDALDVLVLMDEPVPTGAVVPSRLVGVIEAKQRERDGAVEENPRLVALAQLTELFADVKESSWRTKRAAHRTLHSAGVVDLAAARNRLNEGAGASA